MSEKAKWAGIYLLVCFIPLFFYFLPPLSPEIVSHRAITDFLIFAPYVGLTVIAILGWQINQTRIFWSTILLLAFYYYLLHPDTFTVTATGWASNPSDCQCGLSPGALRHLPLKGKPSLERSQPGPVPLGSLPPSAFHLPFQLGPGYLPEAFLLGTGRSYPINIPS